jgi:hypothetical protein
MKYLKSTLKNMVHSRAYWNTPWKLLKILVIRGELSSTGQLWMRIFRELKDIHSLM